jgi:hypothetical protein
LRNNADKHYSVGKNQRRAEDCAEKNKPSKINGDLLKIAKEWRKASQILLKPAILPGLNSFFPQNGQKAVPSQKLIVQKG